MVVLRVSVFSNFGPVYYDSVTKKGRKFVEQNKNRYRNFYPIYYKLDYK